MATALVFDRDRVDEVDDWTSVGRLRRSSILWIDLERADEEEIEELARELDLDPASAQRLQGGDGGAFSADFGHYVHVSAYAPSGAEQRRPSELERIECLVGERFVVTLHERPLAALDSFRERASGSGSTGRLEGLEFLAVLLEWVLESYLQAFETVELQLEEVDERALRGEFGDLEDELERLVELRREIARLRRALVSHREPILALTRPELEAIASSRSAERFAELRDRLEHVIQAARDSRESVVGSFDVLLARTERRTNEIVKVLTLASLALLPSTLLAGVLGMNFAVAIFDYPALFWAVLVVMAGVVVGTFAFGRSRRWI
jgi:magnesium transporter